MKIFVKGRGEVTLSKSDFLAEGGQGKVYAKNGTAYKIYSDPSKMIPAGKFQELSALTNPKIIAPRDIILDSKNKPIGYTMRHVKDTHAIVSLFTFGYKKRHKVTSDMILDLIKDMQATYRHIHENGILVVDGNEMNFLTDNRFTEVYFLDVDSYQTKTYPANALMESIRDRHCNGKFSKETDWFSWGVITFQLLIGIHPYKGKLNGFEDGNWDARMKSNISVLSPGVEIPPICPPFTIIPPVLLDWYKSVFNHGKRLAPPLDYNAVAVIITDVRRIKGSNEFDIQLFKDFGDEIWDYISIGGTRKAILKSNLRKHWKNQVVGITPKMGRIVHAGLDKSGTIQIEDDSGNTIESNFVADSLMSYDGRIYFKQGNKIFQLDLLDTNKNILISTRISANVHANTSKLFDGLVIQSLLGVAHLTIFPNASDSHTIAVKELKGKIVDARFDSGVTMIIVTDGSGKYHRYVIRFEKDFSSYDIRVVNDIVPVGINFVTLDKGISCCINEAGEMELFSSRKDNTLMKIITDPSINTDMTLYKDGNTVMFACGMELYTIKMK